MHRNHEYLQNFSEQDPQQLKQVIEMLIGKSRVLLSNLQDTWEKLQQTETQKSFWKDSYFNLRESCQQYIDSNGLTPYNYIVSLQEELKKQKVYKSCLEEKFKVMTPNSRSPHKNIVRKTEHKEVQYSTQKADSTGKVFSSIIVNENDQRVRYQNKHKIGPKNIQFFKFKEQKS